MEKQNDHPHPQNNRQQKKSNWTQIIRDWQRSGLSQEAFCRDHDIKYSTFVYWRVKALKSKGIQKKQEPRRFIPIQLKPTDKEPLTLAQHASIQLALPNGIRLSIPPVFDQAALATLFSLLGISPC